MSMKDAIFGTAAPTSHGGATYRDSIQAWLPVKNIIGGVVITKDASESIRHRFFLVFQYEAKMRAKRNTVKGIIQRLNEEADTARRYLDICELEVLEPRYTDDFVLKLLYELINKGTSLRAKLPEGVFDMTTEVHGVYGE